MTPEQLAVERDALLQGGRTLEEVERMQCGAVVGALLNDHHGLLRAVLSEMKLNVEAYSSTYGGWYGGDPRDFEPDPECSTPEEREAHRLACEAAERDDPSARDLSPVGGMMQDQRFGLGTTHFVDAELETLIAQLERLLSPPESAGGASEPRPSGETP